MELLTSFIADYGMNVALLPLIIITVFFVHEFGHFFAAFLLGMKVEYVSVGTGKTIWSRTDSRGIKWNIHLIPISAHVHISDYDDHERNTYWKRMLVVLAGPLTNMLLPFALLFIFYASFGKPSVPTIITGVQTDLPAYAAGILPGDEIIAINDEPIQNSEDVKKYTHLKTDQPLRFDIKRGDTVLKMDITPAWYEYKNLDGVEREHGRIGVFFSQRPYGYELIEKIDGYTPTDEDDLTQALIPHIGQNVIIDMEANDGLVHSYLVKIYEQPNTHLTDPEEGEEDLHQVSFGDLGDNFMMTSSIGESWHLARSESIEMIGNIAKIPFNLFPIDKDWLNSDANLSREDHFVMHYLYFFFFKTALFSALIGFINLIPFPGLDGSVILLGTAERIKQRRLTGKQKAMLIGGSLAILYASVFAANAPDMHGYFDFKMERFSDYLSDQ